MKMKFFMHLSSIGRQVHTQIKITKKRKMKQKKAKHTLKQ